MRKRKFKQKTNEQKVKHQTSSSSSSSSRWFCLIEKPGSVLRCKVRKRKIAKTPKIHVSFMEKQLSCPHCHLVFQSNKKWNLDRHMALHRKRVVRYKCSSCSQTYSTEYNYQKHLPRGHRGEDLTKITWILIYEKSHVRPIYPKTV